MIGSESHVIGWRDTFRHGRRPSQIGWAVAAALAASVSLPAVAQQVTPEPVPTLQNNPSFQVGPLTIVPGGWVELMVVNRNRDEGADWASNFNSSIPYPNSHYYDLNEFHLTERQSRLQALILGPQEGTLAPSAYVETDFGGAGSTANLNQSNSFSPRVRHFYAELEDSSNWYLLFGQTWSLVTNFKSGLTPRDENIPLTIDGQYVPGFDWIRVPQVRAVKLFGDTAAVGLSLENPQQQVSANTSSTSAPTPYVYNITGASSAYSGTVTTDYMPDLVLKGAFDPGWGHYEVFGVARGFQSRYTATGDQSDQHTTAMSYGGSWFLPVVPKLLDFTASVLTGKGVGRYGSTGEPDATANPFDGSLTPLRGTHYLLGLTLHLDPAWTVMAYAGREEVSHQSYNLLSNGVTYGYGYGNPLFSDAGCDVEGSSTCSANTAAIDSGTVGAWWKFFRGHTVGFMEIGVTDTYIKREAFAGIGPTAGSLVSPSTNINIVMTSFRYYPFQK